jgi:hypothetical protein
LRADRLARAIREFVPEVDRGVDQDRERLVALLIDHELALRTARREAGLFDATTRRGPNAPDLAGSLEAARTGVAEAVTAAGLGDDLASAREYLGLAKEARNRPSGGHAEPPAPCGIRALGRRTAMVGGIGGVDEPPSRPGPTATGTGGVSPFEGPWDRSVLLGVAMAATLLLATALGGRPSTVAAATGLILLLAVAALSGGPALLVAGLILATMSFRGDRSPAIAGR